MAALARVKYFMADNAAWYWYASEGQQDGDDFRFFGLVVGHEAELGYFVLSELEAIRGPWGLPVERDLYFAPQSLGVLRAYHERR